MKKNYYPYLTEVEDFNTLMGKSSSNNPTPTIPSEGEYMFIYNFIQEELDEYLEACKANDIVEVADALGDIMYVLCNGILLHGLKDEFDNIYQEIQRSNLSKGCKTEEEAKETVAFRSKQKGYDCHYEKVGDGWVVYRSSDGKVQKSINFFPPNLNQFLV